jgi:hypothetical protein
VLGTELKLCLVFLGAVRGFSSSGVWQATVKQGITGKRMQKFARFLDEIKIN